jgi:hypothetical protein
MEARAESEQPGAAWRLLDARSTGAVAIPLIGLGLLGWYFTVRQAGDMSGMITGLGQVGTHMPNSMASPAFMVMWFAMMAAMMLPAIGPVLLAQRMVVRAHGEGPLTSFAFIASYLAVWLLMGLVPLVAFLAFRDLPTEAQFSRWLRIVAGAVLVVAGVYQFTPLKSTCLGRLSLAARVRHKAQRRRRRRGVARGRLLWHLLRRQLLGADGGPGRGRADEPDLDGGNRAHLSGGEELAPRCAAYPHGRRRHRRTRSCGGGCAVVATGDLRVRNSLKPAA